MKIVAIVGERGYFDKGDIFEYKGESLPTKGTEVITVTLGTGEEQRWYASRFAPILSSKPNEYKIVHTGYIIEAGTKAHMVPYSSTIDLTLPKKVIDGWYNYWASKGDQII